MHTQRTSLGSEGPGSPASALSLSPGPQHECAQLCELPLASEGPGGITSTTDLHPPDASMAQNNATQWGGMGISVESEGLGSVPGSEPLSKSLASPKPRFPRCYNSRAPGTALSPDAFLSLNCRSHCMNSFHVIGRGRRHPGRLRTLLR